MPNIHGEAEVEAAVDDAIMALLLLSSASSSGWDYGYVICRLYLYKHQ